MCIRTTSSATAAPPEPPAQAASQSFSASSSIFKFGMCAYCCKMTIWIKVDFETDSTISVLSSAGFGKRFRKPKGPRSHPETWVWGAVGIPSEWCTALSLTWTEAGLLTICQGDNPKEQMWTTAAFFFLFFLYQDNERSVGTAAPSAGNVQKEHLY